MATAGALILGVLLSWGAVYGLNRYLGPDDDPAETTGELDALKDVGLDDNTIVVFATDNGPQGSVVREFGGGMPDMGSPGPHRGELGDVSEGSIRTAAMTRWPGHIRPRSSYTMFSIMDFFPTFARLAGGKVPNDRPIDGGGNRPCAIARPLEPISDGKSDLTQQRAELSISDAGTSTR